MAFISPFRGVHLNYDKIDDVKKEVDDSGQSAYENFPNIPEFRIKHTYVRDFQAELRS